MTSKMSSIKVPVFAILCLAVAVAFCHAQGDEEGNMNQQIPEHTRIWSGTPQRRASLKSQRPGKKEVVAEIYKYKNYRGDSINITHSLEPFNECQHNLYMPYPHAASLKTYSKSIMVQFFRKDYCQGDVTFVAVPGRNVPDLKTKKDDVFKSLIFVRFRY